MVLVWAVVIAGSAVEMSPGSPAGGICAHEDCDDNGLCDICGETVTVTVDFYAINDLHGKFDDSSSQPGVDELTMYFKERYTVLDNVVLLSSGDMWQGSAESNETEGRIVIDWMNELGFESMTLGNHEFDWGVDVIAANACEAEFPFLAINVYDAATGGPVSYCRPSVMIERSGAKIGIIGAIGDCYSSIAPDMTRGIYFVTGNELTELVKKEAARLKAEGADFIVYSLHDGYSDSFTDVKVLTDGRMISYYDTVLSDGSVDLVFEGHTHQMYVTLDGKGVYHLQNGGENKGISHARAVINPVSGSDSVTTVEIVPESYYSQRGSDSLRDELLLKYDDAIAATREVIGSSSEYLGRDELRDIVARLYYEKGEEVWGGDYDIVLGGGFLSVRNPGHLDKGDVTCGMLQSLFPFDNELVLCSIAGIDLDRVFFHSMNDNYFIYCGDYGNEVRDSIDPTAVYYVIVDTYSSTYEPNRLTEIERLGEAYYARDMLADLIRAGGLEVDNNKY